MKLQLALLTSLFLASCTGGGSRHCGTFDLPRALSWSTVDNVGESATFTSTSGKNLTMTLLSSIDNEPFDKYSRSGAENVVCDKYSERQYVFGNQDAGLFIKITQYESMDEPFEEQSIHIEAHSEAPASQALDYRFSLFPSWLEYYGSEVFPTLTRRLLSDADIGGVQYDIAVEEAYTDTTEIVAATPNGIDTISSLVFAKGNGGIRDGLVRIGFTNGETYTRVD